LKQSTRLLALIISVVVGTNILVFVLAGYSIYITKQQYELRAKILTQNVASALDQSITGSVEKIDLALRTTTDELERQMAGNGINPRAMTTFLALNERRLPEVENFRITNEEGVIILGSKALVGEKISVADRDYFAYLHDHADDAMRVSSPMIGRVLKKPLIPFVRRYSHRDGRFAGVVYATVAVDRLDLLLANFNMGPNGSLILRGPQLGLIARFPKIPENPAGQLGNKLVSSELRQQFDSGAAASTFLNSTGGDGVQRIVTFRRMAKVPLIVIAGVASADYLEGWWHEVYLTALLVMGFLVLSALFAGLLLRFLSQSKRMGIAQALALHRLQSIASRVPGMVYQYLARPDGSSCFPFASEAIREIYRVSPEDVHDDASKIFGILHPDDKDSVVASIQRSARDLSPWNYEYRVKFMDGTVRWLLGNALPQREADGCVLWHGFITDITDRKAAEHQLRMFSLAVEQSPESIVITNIDAKIEYVNEAFVLKTGYQGAEVIGRNPRLLKSGKTPRETYTNMWTALTLGKSWRGEFINRRKDHSEYTEHVIVTPIRQAGGQVTHYVAVKEDITARKIAEDEINNLAFYDPLTLLPNRRLLGDRLKQALASSARTGRYGALLFIDLDNFKVTNDTLGHSVGDLLLQQVGKRLVACVREGDTVARLGGDEFVLMLEGLSENLHESASQAKTIGENVLATISQPYLLGSHHCRSTPSIGVTLFTDHLETCDELLKRADLAMYEAKKAGRNTLRFFDPEMQAEVAARASLEADLRNAVLCGQFKLFYQAQVNGDGVVTGVEALIRWLHPERGLVPPAEFIPLAEETGLILPLGHWVLETACSQLKNWSSSPAMSHLSISVNVSAIQFHHKEFVAQVLAVIQRTGAQPQHLKLELTESLLVHDVEDVIVKMNELKANGLGFSLDDFGTGYSSLSYLKRLPLDQLKIDQGFVRDILVNPNDAAIAKMVIVLADSLGLAVIAEGVETVAQRDFLAEQGCHDYQGYLFSRPIPIEEFEAFAQRG
jgi:diguanylate cyclase (GGDEF)-like protein/PAS domain S-box-containing protein